MHASSTLMTRHCVDWIPGTSTAEELRTNYIEKGRPVVIGAGVLNNWPANRLWTRHSLLKR